MQKVLIILSITIIILLSACGGDSVINMNNGPKDADGTSTFVDSLTLGWTKIADCNCDVRNSAASFALDGNGYIVGGTPSRPDSATNQTLRYIASENKWLDVDTLPVRKSMAIGFSNIFSGFIIGGSDVKINDYTTQDVYVLDKSSLSWSKTNSFISFGFQNATSFRIGNYEYLIGGIYNIDGQGTLLSTVWRFDHFNFTWSQLSDFPGGGRSDALAFSLNGKGYFGLGKDIDNLNDLWKYNPTSDTWEQMNDFPFGGRSGATSFVIDDQAYLGFGEVGFEQYSNSFYEYDPIADTWEEIESFPGAPRKDASAFVIDSIAYVGFGANIDTSFNDFYAFKPE